MKKAVGFILVAASLLLASGSQAQGLRVKANIPFDFNADNAVHPAGAYDINAISDTSIVLNDEDTAKSSLLLQHVCSAPQPSKRTVLVFHRVGDEYFLYQIWTAGSDTGRQFATPKRAMQLAQNGARSEEVIVAANLIK